MKRTNSNRRIARKIGRDDDEEPSGSAPSDSPEPVVKRPPISSKTKKSSKLRLSFGPGESEGGDDDEGSAVITPRKNLSRQAIERNAERKTIRPAISSEHLAFRAGNDDRPSYSKDFLAELKQSTPSTPKDISSVATSEDEEVERALDVANKFGPTAAAKSSQSAIPTQAEIRQKKERRARLAQEGKEKDFIGLDADDSEEERREILLRPKEKYLETRLVRDDEDIAEGFEEFTEDGRIALGRKAEREAKRRKRKEMEELIADAEAAEDEETDESEAERNEAYEAAQTRAGTYGTKRRDDAELQRPRTPPKITPVPELGAVLERLRGNIKALEDSKAGKLRKLEELKQEKKQNTEHGDWIQSQLKQVGERYEKLRLEAGMTGTANGVEAVKDGQKMILDRGLESYGNTPAAGTPVTAMSEAEEAS